MKIHIKISLLFLFLFLSSNINSQSQFELSLGGAAEDRGHSIIYTSDGGYAIAGITFNNGAINFDFYIVKLNADGAIQWSRTVGGLWREEAFQIIQTRDQGYAIVGYTHPLGQGTDEDMYLVKLDSEGTFQWHKSIGGFDVGERNRDFAYSLTETNDGGFALAGYTWAPLYYLRLIMVKLNENGEYEWSKVFGSTGGNIYIGRSIIQTSDNGYAIAGYTRISNVENFYILKLDESGNFEWNTSVGGQLEERAYSIVQTSDGGYVIAGETLSYSFGGLNQNMYIVKLNHAGVLQWTRVVGGFRKERAYEVKQSLDGGFIVVGHTTSHISLSANRVYVVKLNPDGELMWSKTVGGDWSESANSVAVTNDGGFATVGFTLSFGTTPSISNMYVIKFDSVGNTCENSAEFMSQTSTGGNTSTLSPGSHQLQINILEPTPMLSSGGNVNSLCKLVGTGNHHNEAPTFYKLSQNYPNPFNPVTLIKYDIPMSGDVKLSVFDIRGIEVSTLVNSRQEAGSYSIEFNGSNLPSGVYFYELRVDGFVNVMRMVLLK